MIAKSIRRLRLAAAFGVTLLLANSFSLCLPEAAAQTTLFTDNFNDNSAGWVFVAKEPEGFLGSEARFSYDYSAQGIPEAPNSQSGDAATTGVRLGTNFFGFSEDQAGIVLTNPAFAGRYTVQVDMWANWSIEGSQVGTTEHMGIFVGSDTAENPIPNGTPSGFPVQRGAGILIDTDGDCGNCDYILLKNRLELDTYSGQYSVREFNVTGGGNQQGYDFTDVNDDPTNGILLNLPEFFPEFDINEATGGVQADPGDLQPAGAAGFRWLTLTVDVDANAPGNGPGGPNTGIGTATFTITNAATGQSFVLGTVDNSQPDILDDDENGADCETGTEDICINGLDGDFAVDLEGQITLAIVDFFSSVANDQEAAFALFDNLIVTIPDATGLAGDFNDDGVVDAIDYALWRENLGATDDSSINDAGDGVPGVTSADFDVWLANYGATAPGAVATTPEPATGTMLAGLAALLAARCRKSHSKQTEKS